MAVKKQSTQKKIASKTSKNQKRTSIAKKKTSKKTKLRAVGAFLARPFVKFYRRLKHNREQSVHKSFVRTRRRDKAKLPKVEGIISFSWYVLRVILQRKWLYTKLLLTFVVISIFSVGLIQLSNAESLNEVMSAATTGGDVLNPFMKALNTVGSALSGALNAQMTDIQYLSMSALYIGMVLTTVWLLRQQLADRVVKVRDGVYSSIAPIISEYILVLVGVLQLIPFALAAIVYTTAMSTGFIDGGIEAAMFGTAIALVVVLTLYFMTTTLFALFVATIPGTYPIKAYKAARVLVAGQRARLLIRLLWCLVLIIAMWFIVLIPIVIIANSFGSAGQFAIPVAFQTVVGMSFIYGTAYAYLLYRRMIDEPVREK